MTARGPLPPALLIGHRGWPRRFPENSLPGFRAALERGATMFECDVQLSADAVPLVIHDAGLQRTAGVPGNVLQLDTARLREIQVNESERLHGAFTGVRIPTLDELLPLLAAFPGATCFVELKRASIRHFGARRMLDAVLPRLAPVAERCVMISSDHAILAQARTRGIARTGWVLKPWGEDAFRIVEDLAPEFVFCATKRIPPGAAVFVPGPWRWVVYAPDTITEAWSYIDRGAHLVETDAVGELMVSTTPPPTRGTAPE